MEDGSMTEVTVATRVAQYVRCRDKIKEMEEAHKKELAPYKELLDQLEGWLQIYMSKTNSESIKTEAGTVYTTKRFTASLADPDAFMKFVIDSGAFELLDRRANATAVKDYVQENGGLPPGVNLTGIEKVGVRRAS
jgi:hypothetical protein